MYLERFRLNFVLIFSGMLIDVSLKFACFVIYVCENAFLITGQYGLFILFLLACQRKLLYFASNILHLRLVESCI